MHVTDDDDQAALEEALTNLAQTAARLPHILGWRAWESMHSHMDRLLTIREALIAGELPDRSEQGDPYTHICGVCSFAKREVNDALLCITCDGQAIAVALIRRDHE